MATVNKLLSDDPAVIASGLKPAIANDTRSAAKAAASLGEDYYNAKHEILDNRIFYYTDAGHLVEDKHAANVRIPHPFLTELIDQKVSYLLSNPVEFDTGDDVKLKDHLTEYIDEDFQLALQNLLSGASQKGAEYLFARTTADDKLTFQVADMRQTFPVYNAENTVERIVRSYIVPGATDDTGAEKKVARAEVWDSEKVWFFESEYDRPFVLDDAVAVNPRPHVIAHVIDDNGETVGTVGRGYGRIPFYRHSNNTKEVSDLAPVKAIIDDYDLMNAFLSNNLQDFTDALYVVSGYPGQDLDALRTNLKAKKAVAVAEGGNVDIKTVNVPVEGRARKMEIDKENIYKFGMGFDSSQVGDGNVTNVVIKSRYALLNMKAAKAEALLRSTLRWAITLIIDDINRRFGTSFKPHAVKFTFNRDQLVSATDDAQVEFTKAQTTAIVVNTILAAAPHLDSETTLRALCETFDLDWEEVQARIEEEAMGDPLDDEPGLDPTEPVPGTGAPAQNEA